MKLVTYIQNDIAFPGVIIGDVLLSLHPHIDAINPTFFHNQGIDVVHELLKVGALQPVTGGYQLSYPVRNPSKMVCIGFNYKKHIVETNWEAPKYPVFFLKATTALTGAYDNIIIAPECEKVDWEVELSFVIGKTARRVAKENAMEYVAGYAIFNDVSERMFQLERGSQWTPGKSFDTFAPMGPYLVTADEISNPHNLALWTRVNGKIMQEGNTTDLIFKIPELIEYISHVTTLLPGDIISTGTPSGVAMGRDDKPFLKPGDVVEQGIEGLGTTKQICVAL
ncbi:MAG: fumarylacetoacetate hydrolase family protein [Marinifilaceae bacterium]